MPFKDSEQLKKYIEDRLPGARYVLFLNEICFTSLAPAKKRLPRDEVSTGNALTGGLGE